MAATEEQVSAAWETKFLGEFAGRGAILQPHELAAQVARTAPCEPCPAQHLPSRPQLLEELSDAAARTSIGTAMGDDQVPSEVFRAAGLGYMRCLAHVAHAAMRDAVPAGWRTGIMAPVPKKPGPLTLANSRGILCSSQPGKLLARCCRTRLAGALALACPGRQHGAISGGGTEFPRMATSLFLAHAAALGCSVAVIFTDLKAAFYTIAAELAVGLVHGPEHLVRYCGAAGIVGADADIMQRRVLEARDVLASRGVPPAWCRLAADWHRCASFHVRGSQRSVVPMSGTRPGDPAADAVFALAFARFSGRPAGGAPGARPGPPAAWRPGGHL